MSLCIQAGLRQPGRGKQHRRPRFSSTHNVKHPRTMGSRPAIRRIRPGLVGRPVCDEARGISPSPLSRQQPFLAFFNDPKIADFERQLENSGPYSGPAFAIGGLREGAIYTRPIRRSRCF
jgi:hypothetical protein